jgi:hypothetical protein
MIRLDGSLTHRSWRMKVLTFVMTLLISSTAYADRVTDAYLRQLSVLEQDLIPVIDSVPTERYGFRPFGGAFYNPRSFAEEVKHVATMIYVGAATVLEEPSPYGPGPSGNGPDAVQTKENIVDYFKGSLEYARRAMKSLTEKNLLDPVTTPSGTELRLEAASALISHAYIHYGEMMVYARWNGFVPPGANERR